MALISFLKKLLPLMITNAFQDKPLPIYGDGKQQRDWLHVGDNCRGILTVLERGKLGEVYNIGGLDVTENLSLVRELLRLAEKPDTLISYVQDRPGHDRRYALSCEKIEAELGWRPAISLDDGLRQTIGWYRNSQKWLNDVRAGEYRSYYEKYYDNRSHSPSRDCATKVAMSKYLRIQTFRSHRIGDRGLLFKAGGCR
jgi:dTDP-glucose 4,6-dehydratase